MLALVPHTPLHKVCLIWNAHTFHFYIVLAVISALVSSCFCLQARGEWKGSPTVPFSQSESSLFPWRWAVSAHLPWLRPSTCRVPYRAAAAADAAPFIWEQWRFQSRVWLRASCLVSTNGVSGPRPQNHSLPGISILFLVEGDKVLTSSFSPALTSLNSLFISYLSLPHPQGLACPCVRQGVDGGAIVVRVDKASESSMDGPQGE